MAAIVWNGVVSAIPEAEIEASIIEDEITNQLQQELAPSVGVPGLVRGLVARKQSLFADDVRFIFDVRSSRASDVST